MYSKSYYYQWAACINNNKETIILFSGYNNNYLVVNQNRYWALIVESNGCLDTSECFLNVPLNTTELTDVKDVMNIAPNPTQDFIYISGNLLGVNKSTIKILNIQGQIINEVVVSGNQQKINLPDTKGIYFIEIASQKEVIFREKVIKM